MPFAAAALTVLFAAATLPPLHPEGAFFKDDRQGVVILRGVNVAGNAKIPPFVGLTDAAQLDPLQHWGMNVMRLLITWEAYEPQPEQYNEAYLDRLVALAKEAERRGIYTLVDFHQDAMARTLIGGCGEGFPPWAIAKSVPQHTPDNSRACSNWGVRMLLDKDLQAAWKGFYANEENARVRFIAMAERVANRFRDVPGVLGYDLLNEPLGDERTELAPLHVELTAALRRGHPQGIVFVTPHANTSAGIQSDLESPPCDNAIYAPHFYDPVMMATGIWMGTSMLTPFHKMLAKSADWQVPLFIGEFGAPANAWRGRAYMDTFFTHLDDSFVSGTQWGYTPGWTPEAKDGWNGEDFSIVDHTGKTRANFKPRAYPQRIAGTPIHFTFKNNGKARVVELTWAHLPHAGDTRIVVPEEVFMGRTTALSLSGEDLRCAVDVSGVTCESGTVGLKTVRLE